MQPRVEAGRQARSHAEPETPSPSGGGPGRGRKRRPGPYAKLGALLSIARSVLECDGRLPLFRRHARESQDVLTAASSACAPAQRHCE